MAGLVEVPNEPEFEANSWGRTVDEPSCRLPVEVRHAVAEWDSVRSAARDCHPAYGCHAFACTEFGATRACYRVGDVVDWDALASSSYNWSFSVVDIEDGSGGLVSIECLDGSGTRLYRHVDFNEEWAGSALAGIPPVLQLTSSVSSEQIDRSSRRSMRTEPEIANSMLRALVRDGVAAFPVPLLSHDEVHLPALQLGNSPIGNFQSELPSAGGSTPGPLRRIFQVVAGASAAGHAWLRARSGGTRRWAIRRPKDARVRR